MKKIFIVLILFNVSTYSLYAQKKTIEGRVIDDNLKALPYVSIMINDTVKIGKTDLNGFFHIEIPVSVKKILFSTVGIELASVELAEKCDEVEVVMMLSGTYDFITHRRVDQLRMKRFNKLPELHKVAFEKGIFKTIKACYTQEFIPCFKKSNVKR
ncbi:carboxypeptidase-like protein [Mucilaginibacter yixingensis]|uniref:Carboxypeptidase-like protein n=1 Tax=Mucilaginibacter yixingensis TaxID=1295612 RepID=A0A2T5J5A1_9SPHI|nr:carboxypeptidase-like regulatory domain-containing protein [Mucilaginibacter yixingensis]PTQ92963.1 carboxypeptidase-like protein [Mucilaginibacter yixingensis]